MTCVRPLIRKFKRSVKRAQPEDLIPILIHLSRIVLFAERRLIPSARFPECGYRTARHAKAGFRRSVKVFELHIPVLSFRPAEQRISEKNVGKKSEIGVGYVRNFNAAIDISGDHRDVFFRNGFLHRRRREYINVLNRLNLFPERRQSRFVRYCQPRADTVADGVELRGERRLVIIHGTLRFGRENVVQRNDAGKIRPRCVVIGKHIVYGGRIQPFYAGQIKRAALVCRPRINCKLQHAVRNIPSERPVFAAEYRGPIGKIHKIPLSFFKRLRPTDAVIRPCVISVILIGSVIDINVPCIVIRHEIIHKRIGKFYVQIPPFDAARFFPTDFRACSLVSVIHIG